MEAGAKHGMIGMDQYLAFLIKQGVVEVNDACAIAHDPATVRALAGVPAAAPAATPPAK
jgi:Tfp pilus assembly pilus retraction ATPase PilT